MIQATGYLLASLYQIVIHLLSLHALNAGLF